MIEFTCGNCGSALRVGEEKGGRTGKCPKCGSSVQVPAQSHSARVAQTTTTGAAPPSSFTCPNGHKLKIPAGYAGKQVKCPACEAIVAVPKVAQRDASHQAPGDRVPPAKHDHAAPATNATPSTSLHPQAASLATAKAESSHNPLQVVKDRPSVSSPSSESADAEDPLAFLSQTAPPESIGIGPPESEPEQATYTADDVYKAAFSLSNYTTNDVQKATWYLLNANAEARDGPVRTTSSGSGFFAKRRTRKIAEVWQGCRTATGDEVRKHRQTIISYGNKAIPFITQQVNTSDPVSVNNGCIILAEIATRDSPLGEVWNTLERLRGDQRLEVEARAVLAKAFDWRCRLLLLMKDIADSTLESAREASLVTATERINAAVRQSFVDPVKSRGYGRMV